MMRALAWMAAWLPVLLAGQEAAVRLDGEIVDDATGQPLPARLYIQDGSGKWHFARSASPAGSAVVYDKENWINHNAVERHTTLSAHPFTAEVPAGACTITIERGKEYATLRETVSLPAGPDRMRFRLKRWIRMSERGWFSGDTHVHRSLEDLPNVQMAEDLNVALPLTGWVRDAYRSPAGAGGEGAVPPEPRVTALDATHVFYPLNTEYEIFTVDKKQHTLGAIFVLNHRKILDFGVPPVRPIAEAARMQGALLELDKHNWPWSMMLVPVLQVDLYELSNNHVWRTEFGFSTFGEAEAPWMQIEKDAKGFTEKGWIDFGLQNYYALLDCGFRMRPTAGTASGVHPVPLGFGRVYVHIDGEFTYEKWLDGLNRGRSFVTTGPMLLVQVNGKDPGSVLQAGEGGQMEITIQATALSLDPVERLEIAVNGEIRPLEIRGRQTLPGGARETTASARLTVDRTSWVAARCYEMLPGGRTRFAHSAPVHIDIGGRPMLPRKREVEYLMQRVESEIKRHTGVLPEAALDEYREALRRYQEIARTALP